MRMYDIIAKKRDGFELSKEEIEFFIKNYVSGNIPDYQASALLMAIYFNKMNEKETVYLTKAMLESGEIMDLSAINGIKVDKHSTGGVGDKTTLIVAPLASACGVPVAKMSGRGLGHTGGTIDKLESFKGFCVNIPTEKFIENVNRIKIALAAQTSNLVPADKKIYALRDVTATVENSSLIASSIMSKKLASGADAILLDVKCGNGAFMKDFDSAIELAKEMVSIGNGMHKETIALITDMNQPLGNAVGNSVEVIEAIETLKGNGPKDLTEICVVLGAYMLILSGLEKDFETAKELIQQKIEDGSGLLKLKQMVENQGGNFEDDLETASNIIDLVSEKEGYVQKLKAESIGKASLIIGAGREIKESTIDLQAGIILNKKVGDFVKKGEVLAKIYINDLSKLEEAKQIIRDAYIFSKEKVEKEKLIKAIVTKDKVTIL